MNFCSNCGKKVVFAVPEGDDKPRFICPSCSMVHYSNPRLVVGCIPRWKETILLAKRGIHPRMGKWTLPAGFLENGETPMDGAIRETIEETRANVENLSPFAMFSLTRVHQIYLLFLSDMREKHFEKTMESTEVGLFHEDEIPWEEIAFPVIRETLKWYFSDRKTGIYQFHMGEINEPLPDE